MGNRKGGFPEALLRRFCITRVATVIRLTGSRCYQGSVLQCDNALSPGVATIDIVIRVRKRRAKRGEGECSGGGKLKGQEE